MRMAKNNYRTEMMKKRFEIMNFFLRELKQQISISRRLLQLKD